MDGHLVGFSNAHHHLDLITFIALSSFSKGSFNSFSVLQCQAGTQTKNKERKKNPFLQSL